MPRQIATLLVSMPALGSTCGRRTEGVTELEKGTTTINSSGLPTRIASADRTTAGLCFPGSPRRAALKAVSQISPLRGSVDSIFESALPQPVLSHSLGTFQVFQSGFALG